MTNFIFYVELYMKMGVYQNRVKTQEKPVYFGVNLIC